MFQPTRSCCGSIASGRDAMSGLLSENVSEDERRDDRRIGLDDEFRRIRRELAPSDLLVGNGPRVRAVARRRVADLAEVAPFRDVLDAQVLLEHRHDADREIPGDAASDLEEAD